MTTPKPRKIRFAAVGDLLLTAKPGGAGPGRGLEALSDGVLELFASCDIVFANLECTLAGCETVSTEPRVVSTEKQIQSLRNTGINVVTLGNNHTFDCLDEGFHRLSGVLADLRIPWCGAGINIADAFQPAVMKAHGVMLAFLGVVDKSSGPFRFAGKSTSGVAPLDTGRVCRIIKDLRYKVDHVIVSPHWGEERFRVPSLEQIMQARSFVDAGASMVLGHHPHVLQGMELYHRAPIAYSLGNFIANNVYWTDGNYLTWSRFERTGCILVAELDSNGIQGVQQIPIFDDGETVCIEKSGWGYRCLCKVNRFLARGVTPKRYRREEFRIRTLKPILSHLRWSELRRTRPKHIRKAMQLLLQKGKKGMGSGMGSNLDY